MPFDVDNEKRLEKRPPETKKPRGPAGQCSVYGEDQKKRNHFNPHDRPKEKKALGRKNIPVPKNQVEEDLAPAYGHNTEHDAEARE